MTATVSKNGTATENSEMSMWRSWDTIITPTMTSAAAATSVGLGEMDRQMHWSSGRYWDDFCPMFVTFDNDSQTKVYDTPPRLNGTSSVELLRLGC